MWLHMPLHPMCLSNFSPTQNNNKTSILITLFKKKIVPHSITEPTNTDTVSWSLWRVGSKLKCSLVGLESTSHSSITRLLPFSLTQCPSHTLQSHNRPGLLYSLLAAYTPSSTSLQAFNFFFNCLCYLLI